LFSVHVAIIEKISLQANRDGGLESLEVKGDLELTISDPSLTKIKLSVRASDDSAVQFKVIIFIHLYFLYIICFQKILIL
jgi:hypothetical protein